MLDTKREKNAAISAQNTKFLRLLIKQAMVNTTTLDARVIYCPSRQHSTTAATAHSIALVVCILPWYSCLKQGVAATNISPVTDSQAAHRYFSGSVCVSPNHVKAATTTIVTENSHDSLYFPHK